MCNCWRCDVCQCAGFCLSWKDIIMEIKSVTVLLLHGTDRIFVKTELPCPYVLAYLPEQTPLTLFFDATHDTGIAYVRKVFGVEPEVINGRKN